MFVHFVFHKYLSTFLFPDHLKKPLDDYVSKLTKVRILRTSKREGLIRARLLGANAARAQVITFLDAHCEANVNWLEPLLDRIRKDRTIVSVPVIDIISSTDFSYSGTPAEVIGGFSWDMQFNWHSLPQSIRNQRKDSSQPIRLVCSSAERTQVIGSGVSWWGWGWGRIDLQTASMFDLNTLTFFATCFTITAHSTTAWSFQNLVDRTEYF